MTERRFDTEFDTPCPFRLERFGYRRLGEFRAPKFGDLFIFPSAGPELQENEPLIGTADRDFPEDEPRHIVEPMPEGGSPFEHVGDPLMDLLAAILLPGITDGSDDESGKPN